MAAALERRFLVQVLDEVDLELRCFDALAQCVAEYLLSHYVFGCLWNLERFQVSLEAVFEGG